MNSTLAIGVGYRPEFMSAGRRPLPRDDLPAGWLPYCSMPKEGALDALSACSDAMRLHENWKPIPRIYLASQRVVWLSMTAATITSI